MTLTRPLALLRRAQVRRAGAALGANGLVSVASLVLAVAVARRTGIAEFGQFALATLVWTMLAGMVRAAVVETALARSGVAGTVVRSAQRASLVALVAASGTLVAGLALQNRYLLVLAACVHGLTLLDFQRVTEAAVGDARRSVVLSAAWSVPCVALAVVSFQRAVDPVALFAVWAGGGAAVGYLGALRAPRLMLPAWPRRADETRAAWLFALDYGVGAGGSALSTLALGGAVGTAAVGAIRGAGTLLGPANLLSTTLRSLLIPHLVRAGLQGPASELRAARRVALLAVCGVGPLLALLTLLPGSVGTQLLGATWSTARPVLLALALESLLALVSSIPAAGYRAALAGRRALVLRLVTGVPRPFVVVLAGVGAGAPGAAWAMAAIAGVNAVLWWGSYVGMLRRRDDGPVPAAAPSS